MTLSTLLESRFTQLCICLAVLSPTHVTCLCIRMSLEIVKRLPETQAPGVCTVHPPPRLCSTEPICPSKRFLVWVFLTHHSLAFLTHCTKHPIHRSTESTYVEFFWLVLPPSIFHSCLFKAADYKAFVFFKNIIWID